MNPKTVDTKPLPQEDAWILVDECDDVILKVFTPKEVTQQRVAELVMHEIRNQSVAISDEESYTLYKQVPCKIGFSLTVEFE